jgi:A/G-specific adenine glycosylase
LTLQQHLLEWYSSNARVLPWRDSEAGTRDPYRTWLSETLLQQTQVSRGSVYYTAFIAAFRTVQDLAAARLEAVLKLWEGAGYYARARNLHAAARVIAQHGFPATLDGWRDLPGVGRYTAGAVLSLSRNAPLPVVDGNVRRVLARLLLEPHPTEAWLWEQATKLLEPNQPGAWNEALIELGATICTPKKPRCAACPISSDCMAFKAARVHEIPAPKPRAAVRQVHAVALLITDGSRVYLEQRAPNGLLGGLHGVPLEPITTTRDAALARLLERYGLPATGTWVGRVAHTMTHRQFTVEVYRADAPAELPLESPLDVALSKLDAKVLSHATLERLF